MDPPTTLEIGVAWWRTAAAADACTPHSANPFARRCSPQADAAPSIEQDVMGQATTLWHTGLKRRAAAAAMRAMGRGASSLELEKVVSALLRRMLCRMLCRRFVFARRAGCEL